MVYYEGWKVELPLWLGLLSAIIIVSVFMFFTSIFAKVQYWVSCTRSYLEAKRLKKAEETSARALQAIIVGNLDDAINFAERSTKISSGLAQINYLTQIRALHEQGDYKKRDELIEKIIGLDPDYSNVYKIFSADLRIKSGDFDGAHVILSKLFDESPKNKQVLRLLAVSSLKIRAWEQLELIVPRLKKTKAISSEQLETVQKELYSGFLIDMGNRYGKQELLALWSRVPKRVKQYPGVVEAYLQALEELQLDDIGAPIIISFLKKNLVEEVVPYLVSNKHIDKEQKRKLLEKWLPDHPQSNILLLSLAKLYMERQIWGKAQSVLEESLAIELTNEAYRMLGDLYDKKGEVEVAKDYYARASKLPLNKVRGNISSAVSAQNSLITEQPFS